MKRRSQRPTKSPAVVNKKWLARQQRPFKPTEKQRGAVEALAGQGFRHEDIARLIMNPHTGSGISPVTLRQHFREELDRGPPKANSMVGQTLYQRATGGGDWRKASPLDQPCHADVLLSIANDEDGT
jgi:hypothetical protein